MAGDSKLFQEALKRGSAHAWNEQWDRAAEEYRRALREMPEDVSARTYLAMALYKAGSLQEALELYQTLWAAQPSNLTMLQRVAELQEAMGNRGAASLSYGRLSEAHTRKRALKEAFRAFHKVVELSPANPLMWNSLIQMAVQAGTVKEIIPGYLGFARDLALKSRFQEALQVAERARTLDPANPLVVPMLAAIRKGIEYSLRAASFGEEVYPEDLMLYIPSIDVLRSRIQTVIPAAEIYLSGSAGGGVPLGIAYDQAGPTVVRSVGDSRNVVEIRLAPTPGLLDQGITASSVRDSLGGLGEVVRVSPESVSGGGVVFVIVLSTSAGVSEVQRTVEHLWHAGGPEVRVQAGPAEFSAVDQIELPAAGSYPSSVEEPAAEADDGPSLVTEPVEEAPEEETVAEVPAEEAVADFPLEEAVVAIPADEVVEEVPADEAVADVVTEEVVDEVSTGEAALEAPIEEAAPEAPTDEVAAEASTEEAAPETSMDLPVSEGLVDEPVSEDLAEEPILESVVEEPVSDVSMEEPVSDVSTEELVSEVPVEELVSEALVEETLAPVEDSAVGSQEEDREEGVLDLPVPDLSWEEFEALTSDQPSAVDDALSAEELVSGEDQLPEEISEESQGDDGPGDEIEELDLLDEIEVPRELEEALARLELEGLQSDDSTAPEELMQPEAEDVPLSHSETAAESVAPPEAEVVAEDMVQPDAEAEDVVQPEAEALDELLDEPSDGVEEVAELEVVAPLPEVAVPELEEAAPEIEVQGEELPEMAPAWRALIEEAEGDLSNHRLDAAERAARRALEAVNPGRLDAELRTVGLLLDILRQRAAFGDLLGVVDGLAWLQSSSITGRLQTRTLETIAAAQRNMLGDRLAEHMDEVSSLPRQSRSEVVATLWKTEKLIDDGKLRLAADEMYSLVSSYPEFLPPQSVLGRILVAQGRMREASERSRRLLDLYELRGKEDGALEVLQWMSQVGIATQDDHRRMVRLLRLRGRESEATTQEEAIAAVERSAVERRAAAEEATRRAIELVRQHAAEERGTAEAQSHDPSSPLNGTGAHPDSRHDQPSSESAPSFAAPTGEDDGPKRGILGMFRALRGGARKSPAEEKAAELTSARQGMPSGGMSRHAMLRLAESSYASGDTRGARRVIRSMLDDRAVSEDLATQVALLRILQVTLPAEDGLREALEAVLATLGIPGDLAN